MSRLRRAILCEPLSGPDPSLVYGPVVQDAYGMEEFAARDPEGYVLGFGQSL